MVVINSCLECGHCVAICPQNAVTMEDYDMCEVEEIADEIIITPKDLLLTIKSRRSIRQFKADKLTEEQIINIREAIRYTATAKNLQDETIVLVQDKIEDFENEIYCYLERKFDGCDVKTLDSSMAALWMFTHRHKRNKADDFLLRQAPAVLIFASDRQWDATLDAGMAAQNAELMAMSMGLGVLYNGYLRRLIDSTTEIKSWLGLDGKNITAVMLIGQPAVKYKRTVPRKKLDFRNL